MKIAAQAGRGPGVQIQKRLYQMKHLTKDRPRVVFRSAGDHSRGRRERKRGRRKRWQGGWTLDGYADRGHIQIQRCLNLIPYASDIQPTYGRTNDLLCFFSSFEYGGGRDGHEWIRRTISFLQTVQNPSSCDSDQITDVSAQSVRFGSEKAIN